MATDLLTPLETVRQRNFQRRPLRKPRSDSKLDYLTDEQHTQLCEWLRSSTLTRKQLVRRMAKEFGFTVSSGCVTNFYKNYLADFLIEQRRKTIGKVSKVNQEIKQNPAEYSTSALDSMWRRLDEMAADPEIPVKSLKLINDAVARLVQLNIAQDELNVKLRQLAMLERRERRMKETLRNSKLTPEETAAKLREIFDK